MADMTKVQDQVSTYAEYLPQPIVQKQIFFLTSGEIRDESVLVQLYDLIKAHPTYQAYPVHWSVYKPARQAKEWCAHKGIPLIEWEEREYLRLLATSGYLLSDIKLPAYFMRRPGQLYCDLGFAWKDQSRGKEYRPEYERRMQAWRIMQGLLQATHILVSSEADIDLLETGYRLGNIYGGRICKIEKTGAQAELLRDLILQEGFQTDQVEIRELPVKKQRVLIQLEWNKGDLLREWMPLWLEYADYEKYDITLVMTKPKDPAELYKLAQLPRQVRVLFRGGHMLYGSTQKPQVKAYVDDFWLISEEEREKKYPAMQKICAYEWEKIFGGASFDTVVLTSMHPLWYLGAEKNCGRKVSICTREIMKLAASVQEERARWEHKWAAMKKMDAVFSLGMEGSSFITDADLGGLQELPTPVPMRWLEKDKDMGQLSLIRYQGREYALLFQGRDWKELRGQVGFIPIPPADRKAYVAGGAPSGILPGFKRLREREPDSLLYIFTGDLEGPGEEIEEDLRESVVCIGGTICGDLPGASGYLQRFWGCLLQEGEERACSDLPAVLMGLLGKPAYRMEGRDLKEIQIQVDKKELYARGREAVNRIWG